MGYTPPHFNVRKITGGYNIFPDGVTTEDLTILPNTIDTYPKISLLGASHIRYYVPTGCYHIFHEEGNELLSLLHTGDDVMASAAGMANHNLFLNVNGTGKIKFGTYTAGAATDSTGYISIIDAAGNTRKLMVQA